MQKRNALFIGIGLITIGLLALFGNLSLTIFGWQFRFWEFWRMWPLIVMGLGIGLALPALFLRDQKWPGMLFIPALPIFITGSLLMFSSLFDAWVVWAYLWPLEILGLALGFMFAALYTRVPWFAIPAILIGMNGLVMQFSALTGLWEAWSVLWTIEPLAIGMILLLVGVLTDTKAVVGTGLAFCGFAAIAALGMLVFIFAGLWVFRYIAPLTLISIGIVVLAASFLSRSSGTKQLAGEGAA